MTCHQTMVKKMNEWQGRFLSSCEVGDVATVRKLLRNFISPNCKDPDDGKSALAKAAQGGHTAVVKLLLEAGAVPNSHDGAMVTPLHLAAKGQHTDAVKLLVLNKAMPDIKTLSGLTAQDFTKYHTDTWQVLNEARSGIMPEYTEKSEVPKVPGYAIENAFKKKPTKKSKKKDKKGKKKGKKKKK